METTTNTTETKQLTAIERALAAAKARKAARPSDEAPTTEAPAAAKTKRSAADTAARAAAKAAKMAELEAARAARRAAREEKRAAKAAAKAAAAATKSPAHMKKVERARSKCPPMSDAAALIFSEATTNLSAAQIDALAQHLAVHNRATATLLAATTRPFPLGTAVRITGGDHRFVGMTGKVVHSQSLHMKVEVEALGKAVYIYNGQAEALPVEAAAAAAAG